MAKTKPERTDKLPRGTYRHAKSGKLYRLIDEAFHSETLEEMVIYMALYGDRDTWARPKSMWLEEVEVNGEKTTRFVLHELAR